MRGITPASPFLARISRALIYPTVIVSSTTAVSLAWNIEGRFPNPFQRVKTMVTPVTHRRVRPTFPTLLIADGKRPSTIFSGGVALDLSLIHISEPTRLLSTSYAV